VTTRQVHVVVTCSQRKREPVPNALHLRRVTGVRTETRCRSWTTRLADDPARGVPAGDLYAGEHWRLARQLPDVAAPRLDVTLWVCSAGYGLISAATAVKPYSATFAAGHLDSVPGGRDEAADWWAALTAWSAPGAGAPRSIAALAAADPTSAVLLVLSSAYFAACRADILAATEVLDDADRLGIVSGGTRTDTDLAEWLLPVDARLQHALGGARQSLNVRVAAALLGGGRCGAAAGRAWLSKLLAEQPPLPTFAREPMTDTQVRAWIRAELRSDGDATHTRLLRELRDGGKACEQRRFADLFKAERRVTA
jgi:hypothetical protein